MPKSFATPVPMAIQHFCLPRLWRVFWSGVLASQLSCHFAAGQPNYFPNSFSGPRVEQRALEARHPITTTADVARYDTSNDDNFTQVGIYWNKVSPTAVWLSVELALCSALSFIQSTDRVKNLCVSDYCLTTLPFSEPGSQQNGTCQSVATCRLTRMSE